MATMPGREAMLPMAVTSLMNGSVKPDNIHVYDNGTEAMDLADNGKFVGLIEAPRPCIYLSCDDDLIYPPDYVRVCVEAVEAHGCIISFHGRRLLGKRRDYYRGHKRYHCLLPSLKNAEIDVPGTGVCAFSTDYFDPMGLHLAEEKRMSDLVFALEAAKQHKRIMHIAHKGGWIRQQPIHTADTIFGMESKGPVRQNAMADMICEIKGLR